MLATLLGGGPPADGTTPAAAGPNGPPGLERWAFLALRILQTAATYISLIPLIIAIALKDTKFRIGLIFGLAWSGFFLLLNLGLWLFKRWTKKREPPYLLDGAETVYFTVYLAIYETKKDWQLDMVKYFNVTIHAWLAFIMLASIAARYPFTKQNAKEVAPEIAWGAPSFRSVCDQLAGLWATSQAITCLLCLAPLMKNSTGTDGLNVSFNYVVPYFLLITMLAVTRFYPRFIRGFWYLPRMHQGTVKPGDDAKPSLESGGVNPDPNAQGIAPPPGDPNQAGGLTGAPAPAPATLQPVSGPTQSGPSQLVSMSQQGNTPGPSRTGSVTGPPGPAPSPGPSRLGTIGR